VETERCSGKQQQNILLYLARSLLAGDSEDLVKPLAPAVEGNAFLDGSAVETFSVYSRDVFALRLVELCGL
jgi:hypothetical protein